MKDRTLRPQISNKSYNDDKFTKSGNNLIPSGMGLNKQSIYKPGPDQLDNHPDNFYKSNRLSSKA